MKREEKIIFSEYVPEEEKEWNLLIKELEDLKDINKEFLKILNNQRDEIEHLNSSVQKVATDVDNSVKNLNSANNSYLSSIRAKILLSVGIGLVTSAPVGIFLGAKIALGTFCFSTFSSFFY